MTSHIVNQCCNETIRRRKKIYFSNFLVAGIIILYFGGDVRTDAFQSNNLGGIHVRQNNVITLRKRDHSVTFRSTLQLQDPRTMRSTTASFSRQKSTSALSAIGPGVGGSGNTIIDTLLGTLGSPIQSIFVLSFVVFIHEAGHFLAARYYDIKVQEFSVGVGPKLFGFIPNEGRLNEGIEFNLRAIPLGGYVRFPENYNTTLANEIEKEIYDAKQEQKKQRQMQQEQQQTAPDNKATTFKSPTLTMLSKVFGSKKDEDTMATTKATVSTKSASATSLSFSSIFKMSKTKPSTTTKNIPRFTKSSKNDDEYEYEIDYYDDPNLLQNRNWFQRGVVLSGGIIFNLLLAFAIYFSEATVGGGLPTPTFDNGCLVSGNPKADSPSYGKLKKGDVIVGINGENLSLVRKSSPLESQQQVSDLISKIRSANVGDEINLQVIDKSSASSAVPKDVTVKSKPLSNVNPSSPSSIGVMLSPNLIKMEKVKATSVIDAASSASNAVYDLTSDTAKSIYGAVGTMIKTIVGKNTNAGGGAMQLSGPIGVIKMGSEVVQTKDVTAVAMFAAAISINLAVVNSLPIPALDGGQLIFVLSEALTGKKFDQRKQEEINALALLVLLLVTFSTTVGDLSK